MKRLGLAVMAMALLVSCQNPSSSTGVSTQAEKDKGTIKVSLPGFDSSSRGALTVQQAKDAVNSYKVIVFDPTSSATPAQVTVSAVSASASIVVPVGVNYSVVVLAAGYMTAENLYYPLGAGEAKGVIVQEAQVTPVNVTLQAVDFRYIVKTPPSVGINSTMVMNIQACTVIPSLQVQWGSWSLLDNTTSSPTYIGGSTITFSPLLTGTTSSQFNEDFTLSLPFNVTSTTNTLTISPSLVYINEGSVSLQLHDGGNAWNFLGARTCPAAISSGYQVNFSPASATTGMDITVGWGADY